MTRSTRVALGLAVMGLMGWFNACGDPSGIKDGDGGEEPTPEATISEPIAGPAASLGGSGREARILSSTVAAAGPGEEVAYITVPPLTRPTADIAVIRNPAHEGSITVAVRGGGFDPVPLVASPGDLVDVQLFRIGGVNVGALSMLVPSRKAPKVVRGNPPRNGRDVPINKHIVVVFSEPIAPASLTTTTFRVRSGTRDVPGTVRLIDGSGLTAAFLPSAPLARDADYRVDVSGVRDIQGDVLTGTVRLDFRTGTTTTGPVAGIGMSVDSLRLSARTYQLSALAVDAAGNILADQTIVWESADPTGLSVSQTGLVTALREGDYDVRARVGDVISSTNVIVRSPEPVHTVTVTPPTASVIAEDTIVLDGALYDATGRRIFREASWTSSDPALATISEFGVITKAPGVVTITVTSGDKSGTSTITITPRRPVASLVLTPSSVNTLVHAMVLLRPTLRAADGRLIVSRPIAWRSTNTAVATVDATGLVMAVATGAADIIATSEGVSDTVTITVTAIQHFTHLMAGWYGGCGLDESGKAYCWGEQPWPVALETPVRFASLTGGISYTCGLTSAGRAYCWGLNDNGQLGTGSISEFVASPVEVTGGLTFVSISAAGGHTCGLTPAGAAYCWGMNGGRLGNGVDGPFQATPSLVLGGLTFSSISAGHSHTCGVTTTGAGYCWGAAPVAVSGGVVFGSISVGGSPGGSLFTCGLTTAGAAWCWGNNSFGQLGNGTTIGSNVPVLVSGGLTFSSVDAGDHHACGLTTTGAAYCWGSSAQGQLGDGVGGGSAISPVPVAVTGGVLFTQLSLAGRKSCALATNQVAWCWGEYYGHSGFGSTVPVRVPGQP